MTSALIIASATKGRATTANTTQYFAISGDTLANTTETNRQVIMEFAGTFSNLWIRIITSNTNASSTYTFRKNALAGNQTVSPGTATTGAFEDTTHTDAVSVADKVNVRDVPSSTGTMTITVISTLFDTGTGNTVTRMCAGMNGTWAAASTTYFHVIQGATNTASNTTEAKVRQREIGTFKNFMVHSSANARTAQTFSSRLNVAAGALTMTLGASTTGFLEDTTHTDTIAVGDDYDLKWVSGTGTASITMEQMALDFVSTAGFTEVSNGNVTSGSLLYAANTTNYVGVGGAVVGASLDATELDLETKARIAFTFQQLSVNIVSNGVTATSTINFRKNAGDGNQTVSYASSVAGTVSDTTHTDSIISTDLVNYKVITGATGTNINISVISSWAMSGAPLYSYTLNETLTFVEAIARAVRLQLSETESISDSFSVIALLVERVLIAESKVRKPIPRIGTQTTTISESKLRKVIPIISAQTITISDAIARAFHYFRTLTETESITSSLLRKPAPRIATQTTTISDAVVKKFTLGRILTETISMVGTVARAIVQTKSLTGTISVSSVLRNIPIRPVTGSVTIVEFTVLRGIRRIIIEAITILDLVALGQGPHLLETITVLGSVTVVKARLFLKLTGSVTIGADAVSRLLKATRKMIEGRCSIQFNGLGPT